MNTFLVVLDVDECNNKSYSCDANAVCQNTKGSYKCICKVGYAGNGNKCSGNCRQSLFSMLFLRDLLTTLAQILNYTIRHQIDNY